MIIFNFINILYLLLLNFLLKNNNFFKHNKRFDRHKSINKNLLIQSGGFFYLPSIFFLVFYFDYFKEIKLLYFAIVLVGFFLIGVFSDFKNELSPSFRLLLHIILVLVFVYFNDFYIIKTNLSFIDYAIQNYFFKYFFTIFCILVFINGLNFTDGINVNSQGYIIQIICSLIFITYNETGDLFANNLLTNFLIINLIFLVFNLFFNNIFGDGGIFVTGFFISILVIYFINYSLFVSPLLAILVLWYPAFENLFSIIRKKIFKINPLKADTRHLHTLLFVFISHKLPKKSNKFHLNVSGLLMNLFFLPGFLISINFYNNSEILGYFTILNIFIYIIFYLKLFLYLKKIENKI